MITDENIKDVIDAFFIPEEIKDELREKIPEIRAGLEARIYNFSVRCRSDLEARILNYAERRSMGMTQKELTNAERHPICPVRKDGQCQLLGGQCETKDEEACDTSREAYKIGYYEGYREAVQNHHDALMTLIKKRDEKAEKL